MDFSKIFQLKGLKSKNKGLMNFYECCDLTKKVYLRYLSSILLNWTIVSKTKCAPDVIYFLFAASVGPLISHPNPNCSLVLVNSSVDKSHNHRLCDYQ